MGAKQNLKQYLSKKGISPAQFYRDSGLSNGFLNQGDNISSNNIEIIISLYPDLNIFWLISSKGEMLNASNSDNEKTHSSIHLLDEEENNIQTCTKNNNVKSTYFPHKDKEQYLNVDLEICRTSTDLANKLLNNESETSIPFYDLPVSAGSLGILDAENANITVPAGYIKLPVFRGCEAIFPIIGISMEPLVHSGDWIGVKSIDNLSRSWDFIQTGVIYLIITREDRMIKFIEKSDDDDFIICSSPNYHPFKVYKGDILNIYRVKAVARGL